jgi:hypothetical protein
MKDYAREENGSQVVMTSCNDEAYPAENMLDGKENSFWITTGLFPQEFVIQLSKPIQVSQIVVLSLNGEWRSGEARGNGPCAHAPMPPQAKCAMRHRPYHALPCAVQHPCACTPLSPPAVKKLAVEHCNADKPSQFEKVFEVGKYSDAPVTLHTHAHTHTSTHMHARTYAHTHT